MPDGRRRCAQDEGQGSGKLGRAATERRMGWEVGTQAHLVTVPPSSLSPRAPGPSRCIFSFKICNHKGRCYVHSTDGDPGSERKTHLLLTGPSQQVSGDLGRKFRLPPRSCS